MGYGLLAAVEPRANALIEQFTLIGAWASGRKTGFSDE
jgi:hypothetical protein